MRLKRLKRKTNKSLKKLSFDYYDQLFKRAALPDYITSFRFNVFRLFATILLVFLFVVSQAFVLHLFKLKVLMIWFIMLLILEPSKPFPMYFILLNLEKNKKRKINSELYNFFNDIKGAFKTNGEKIGNIKYFVMDIKSYYNLIGPSIDKMLVRWNTDASSKVAWETFSDELETSEAERLSIVMSEIDKTSIEETLELLEQLREEFANSIYNAYKDYLQRRKMIVYMIAFICALSIFINPLVAFYQWFLDTMNYMHSVNL